MFQLYPSGVIPDEHNCGICVIYRAETFLYPDKAIGGLENATPAALSKQLDQLRARYRKSISEQRGNLSTEKASPISTVPSVSRKRTLSSGTSDGDPASQPINVSRFSLRNQPTLPKIEPKLNGSEDWKACLLRCAESNGFHGRGIVQAFEEAPASDISSILRALQCICEVANTNLLLRLNRAINYGDAPSVENSYTYEPKNAAEIAQLHHAIGWYDDVNPYFSIFYTTSCQISYHRSFQKKVKSRSALLKEERKKRKQLKSKRTGNVQEEPSNDNSNARTQTITEIAKLIDPQGSNRKGVEEAVKRYEKAGKILNLLQGSRNAYWLLLYPLYDDQPVKDNAFQRPALNIMDFNPPKTFEKLKRPILRAE